MLKKIMNFLFGKKYPIYDSKGQISHRNSEFMDAWEKRYQNSPDLNWRNHSGGNFRKKRSDSS